MRTDRQSVNGQSYMNMLPHYGSDWRHPGGILLIYGFSGLFAVTISVCILDNHYFPILLGLGILLGAFSFVKPEASITTIALFSFIGEFLKKYQNFPRVLIYIPELVLFFFIGSRFY